MNSILRRELRRVRTKKVRNQVVKVVGEVAAHHLYTRLDMYEPSIEADDMRIKSTAEWIARDLNALVRSLNEDMLHSSGIMGFASHALTLEKQLFDRVAHSALLQSHIDVIDKIVKPS
jgi:hypothetical protein